MPCTAAAPSSARTAKSSTASAASASAGKEYRKTDAHYREGTHFEKFTYGGKTFAIGLCGDLWTDGRPEEMHALDADVVLWPVWCDYRADEWNSTIKREYAEQAEKCGRRVLLINPLLCG